jgi:hypothetical protein
MIREEAVKLALDKEIQLKATNPWVRSFLQRHSLQLSRFSETILEVSEDKFNKSVHDFSESTADSTADSTIVFVRGIEKTRLQLLKSSNLQQCRNRSITSEVLLGKF